MKFSVKFHDFNWNLVCINLSIISTNYRALKINYILNFNYFSSPRPTLDLKVLLDWNRTCQDLKYCLKNLISSIDLNYYIQYWMTIFTKITILDIMKTLFISYISVKYIYNFMHFENSFRLDHNYVILFLELSRNFENFSWILMGHMGHK